jgi:hypothetical protein
MEGKRSGRIILKNVPTAIVLAREGGSLDEAAAHPRGAD